MKIKFFKCSKCQKLVAMLKSSACDTICCGEAMTELKPNTTDAAQEKHVPVVELVGNEVHVKIGSVAHPMEEKHFIEFIALESKNGCQIKDLKPVDVPQAKFILSSDDEFERAYAYCNLHGLWAN